MDPDGMWPDWGQLAIGVVQTVGGAAVAVGGVSAAVGSVGIAAAPGIVVANLGIVGEGLGITNIVNSFRDDKSKKMNVPGGLMEATGEKVGGKKGKIAGEIADAVVGGKPITLVDKAVAAVNAVTTTSDLLGEHSAHGTIPVRDHTATPAAKPKPVVKPEPKPKPQATIQAVN